MRPLVCELMYLLNCTLLCEACTTCISVSVLAIGYALPGMTAQLFPVTQLSLSALLHSCP